mmetsp:Transcript_17481/g.52188  ORF Transcript_17481/g.52188 Transcript_17481/m.52188 type:complete len:408 (-) Transcript_17481:384-1607(-)
MRLVHKLLQRHSGDVADELRPGVVAQVPAGVAGALHHRGEVHYLPKEGALQDQLHVVGRPAIELEGHELGPAIETLDVQGARLTAPTFAPTELDDLIERLEEETPWLIGTALVAAAVKVLVLAILVFDDEGLVVRKLDELPHLLDVLVRAWHEQLLLLDQPHLARGLVAHERRVLFVDLDGLLLAAVDHLLVRAQEHLPAADAARALLDPDLARGLVQNLHVLMHLQVDGLQDLLVQQPLVRTGEDGLLPAVRRDLAGHGVDQPDVLVGLERPRLPHRPSGLVGVLFDLPGGLQEHQCLALRDPPLPGRVILEAEVLVLLQRDGLLLLPQVVEGPGEEHAGAALDPFVARQLVFDDDVLGATEAAGHPFVRPVVRAREPHAGALDDRPLPRQAVLHPDEFGAPQARR